MAKHQDKVICLIAYRGDEQNIPSVLFTFCPLKNRLHSRIIIIEGACLFRDLVATTQAAIAAGAGAKKAPCKKAAAKKAPCKKACKK